MALRVPAPADTWRLRTPPQAGCLFPPRCGVRIVYGGSGPRERSGGPVCFGSALPSPGHAASPDPFLARNGSGAADRVRRALDRGGPAAQAVTA